MAEGEADGCIIAVARFSDDLDFAARERWQPTLTSLRDADIAIIDISAVTYADSTFMSAVVRLYKHFDQRGTPFAIRIVGAAAQLRRVFELTQLDRYIEFWYSLDDAKSAGIVTKP